MPGTADPGGRQPAARSVREPVVPGRTGDRPLAVATGRRWTRRDAVPLPVVERLLSRCGTRPPILTGSVPRTDLGGEHMDRIRTYVYASDPISRAGVASQLRARPEIQVMDDAELDQAQVALIVTDLVEDEILRVL